MMIEYGFDWKDRDGSRQSVLFHDEVLTFDQARERAKKYGYPGHKGGAWNYFIDDLNVFLNKIFRRTPDGHG